MGRKPREKKGTDESFITSDKRAEQAAADRDRLFQLVFAGQNAAVEAMLKRGVDANATDREGWPSLFHPSQRGQLALTKLLLAHRATASFVGKSGETPLMMASEQGQSKIARILLASRCSINAASSDGTTALMGACLHSQIDMVRLLLEERALVNASTLQGGTPLDIACHGDKVLSADIAKLLLASRAAVDAENGLSGTPLMTACQNGHLATVQILLAHRANINHSSKLRQTPLATAVMSNQRDIGNILLQQGAVLRIARRPICLYRELLQVPGTRARVQGLAQAVHLNGLTGEILSFDPDTGRRAVRLPDGNKSIKSSNFQPLGNFEVDVSQMQGSLRRLAKLLKQKLGREASSEDFLCLVKNLDEDHLQCTLYLPELMPSGAIQGTSVHTASHPCGESAKFEAVDLAAQQALKALPAEGGNC